VVEALPTTDDAGLYIAEMNGLFAKQGLNVTINFTPESQLAVTSAVNGISDIASADYVTYVRNELGGSRLRIIGEASSLQPDNLALLASPQAGLTSLSSLKDHTVGVAAPDDIYTLLVRALLAEYGITTARVNIKIGFQLQNLAQQLASGQADAAPVPEPFASEGEQSYGLQELADIDQGVTQNFPLVGYAVTQSWAQKYPGTLAAFTRALEQGQEIADSDRATAEAAIEKYLGLSPRTAAVMALPSYPLSVNPTQLQRVVNSMVEFGMLPEQDSRFKMSSMTSGLDSGA
jgi:NitT/TauT family transport system substrate-binding protein